MKTKKGTVYNIVIFLINVLIFFVDINLKQL